MADARDETYARDETHSGTVRNLMTSSQDAQTHEQQRMDVQKALQKTHESVGQIHHAVGMSIDAAYTMVNAVLQLQHVMLKSFVDTMFTNRRQTLAQFSNHFSNGQ